ncbi:hypothetical protein [Novosphingobium sp. M1R2S20]|uniref:Uncharacterized protein n=1 Tax=Novosphingobium rhizovicinum TaxID=3228928 RepID=A0ABV3RE99_9SPHN
MKRAKASGATLAGGILGGGVLAGLMLSLAVPTTMKRQAGEGWRDLIPAASVSVEEEPSMYWMEAPPQDIQPISWLPDESWNSPQWADDDWPPYVDDPVYDQPYGEGELTHADLMVDTRPRAEPIAVGLTPTITGESARPSAADAAAAAAEAARMAAADVRTEIAAAAISVHDAAREPDDFETAFGAD